MHTARLVSLSTLLVSTLATLGCGGLLDEDLRTCTWRSDRICAEHLATRFGDATLSNADRERGRTLVREACDRGDATACVVYAVEIGFERPGFSARRADALTALTAPCKKGDSEACFQVARIASAPGDGQDLLLAGSTYDALCGRGSASACNNLGVMYENGRGLPRDGVEATRRYELACTGGDRLGCSNPASMLVRGGDVPPDPARARALWTEQCDVHQMRADCYRLGLSLRNPRHGDLQVDVANGRIDSACTAGHLPACVQRGMDLVLGEHRPADPAEGLNIWQRACDAGSGPACNEAGVLLARGEKVPADATRAKALYVRGCDLEDGWACYNLSASVPEEDVPALLARACDFGSAKGCNDHGVNQARRGDTPAARKAYLYACDNGNTLGCRNLGYSFREDTPKNLEFAFKAFSWGCEEGDPEQCVLAGEMLTDRAEAKPWFVKACAGGVKAACRR